MSRRKRILAAVLAAALTLSPAAAFAEEPEGALSGHSSLAEAGAPVEESVSVAEEGLFAGTDIDGAEESLSGAESAEEAASGEEEADVTVSRIRFAGSKEEVFEALKSVADRLYYYDYEVLDDAVAYEEDAAADTGISSSAMTTGVPKAEAGFGQAADYSDTNVRTEGVDEADIVKTDGTYICVLRKRQDLCILEATDDGPVLRSTIHVCDGQQGWLRTGAVEFFMNGSLLHVLSSEAGEAEDMDYTYYNPSAFVTRLRTYDISDPVNPVLTGTLEQDGVYQQARMKDGMLYIFTDWSPRLSDTMEESAVLPMIGGEEAAPDHVCIPDIMTAMDYLVAVSVDPKQPSKAVDYKALISGAQQLYVSTEGIYAVNVDYNEYRSKTEIVKFTYDGGNIAGRAAARLRGTVDDTFSIDEYNGYLRVLTTYTGSLKGEFLEALSDLFGFDYYDEDRWLRHNAIYILDEGMNRVGSLMDLAEGEEIKSARYFGDIAYFVTFRNTDPLFTADLGNPAAPRIIGETKLPGFSEYLHPFGDGLMLGLGYDADEDTGSVTGLKISLFDFSDPTDVTETARTVIPNITWCPAIENYKAIFADAGKKLLGFCCEDRYLVYRMEDDGSFERVLLYDLFEDSLQGSESFETMRGLYIGSDFYLAGGSFVAKFDMEDGFAKEKVVRLA